MQLSWYIPKFRAQQKEEKKNLEDVTIALLIKTRGGILLAYWDVMIHDLKLIETIVIKYLDKIMDSQSVSTDSFDSFDRRMMC